MFSSTRQKLIEDNHPYWTAKEIAKRLAGQQIQQELKKQNEKTSGKLIRRFSRRLHSKGYIANA